MALIDTTYADYLNMYKLNFRDWKLVDIDHYMKGNSFFNKILKDTDFQADFDARMGTKEERVKKIKGPEAMKDFKRMLESYSNYLDLKETRSARGS